MSISVPARRADVFLAGGGEMGELIRRHDWEATSLGAPETWPQALRMAVRLILNTGHPMYIFWGPELLCFYNDAYRTSIGPERHPGSLGQPAREVWAEIWEIIGPQIDQVMTGQGATWHENQLVPITRHGQLEEVYWTYSYGPIHDETAEKDVGGVLVVCTETTAAVLAERRLAADVERQRRLFEQAPSFVIIMRGAEHVVEFVNQAHLHAFGSADWVGKSIREAFPDIARQGFLERLPGRRPADMSKALSLDLRTRVLAAVAEGASHRTVGARFGVSAASVSRWRALERVQGDARPGPLGGDRRSGRIEAQAVLIRQLLEETPDITTEELRQALGSAATPSATARSSGSSAATASRAKKDRPRERAGAAGRHDAAAGLVRRPARPRPRAAGVHRRDLGQDQHDAHPRPLPARPAAAYGHAAWPLEDHDLRCRHDRARHDRAVRAGRADQPRRLRGLCRAGAGPELRPGDIVVMDNLFEPQGTRRPHEDRGGGRAPALPSALQPRLQPD